MKIDLPVPIMERYCDELNKAPFELGIDNNDIRWKHTKQLNLELYEKEELEEFANLLEADEKPLRGQKTIVRDIRLWNKARTPDGSSVTRGRTVKHAVEVLKAYMTFQLPNRRVFRREADSEDGVILGYYVESIDYEPPKRSKDYYSPPRIILKLVYESFGVYHQCSTSASEDIIGMTGREILIEMGYIPESPELNALHDKDYQRYNALVDQVGLQLWATGTGDPDGVDGNGNDGYSWRRDGRILLGKDGSQSRVLVDVFKEGDSENRRTRDHTPSFWQWNITKYKYGDDGMELDETDETDEDAETGRNLKFEIPIHPYIIVFDLKRHKRMQVHVGNLTEYIYDKSIIHKLVLPQRTTKLIDTLLADQHCNFKDIVVGKSGGIIVICQGSPGTGKTLSAEVYAEFLGRGLYTVQCAQLGTSPDELEKNLMKCLSRGDRWGAVTLLDEADVYLQARGTDLIQNAVVGVFLRVLEYFNGVLFLTTNRLDAIDDAILSRCTAVIQYTTPEPEDQKRIWRIMAAQNAIDIPEDQIDEIVDLYPMAGREIKNVLKLCMMVAHGDGAKVDADLVGDLKDFRPIAADAIDG